MTNTGELPKARTIFRRLALAMAIIFFVAAVFGIMPAEHRAFGVGVCLFVAIVMLMLARTGYWPPPRGQ
jgi:hypothetical protein